MRTLTFLLLLTLGHGVVADGIESVRLRSEAARSRIVFDLVDVVNYRVFQMKNPERVVIDIQDMKYPRTLSLPADGEASNDESFRVLDRMRYAVRNENGLRIVLDLNERIDLQHTLLPPRQNYGHRLVVDLYRRGGPIAAKAPTGAQQTSNKSSKTPPQSEKINSEPAVPAKREHKQQLPIDVPKLVQSKPRDIASGEIVDETLGQLEKPTESPPLSANGARALALLNGKGLSNSVGGSITPTKSKSANTKQKSSNTVSEERSVKASADNSASEMQLPQKNQRFGKPPRNVVIAIDAGHGGHDVGAIGPKGTYEKNIVLQISRELAATINKQHGMRAILTRSSDTYVGLRARMQRARQQEADLFISIHADAFRDRRVSGSSVYVLSQHGASSEAARWLAENENAADLVGGVSLGDKDDVVKSVLIDLSQTASIDASIDAADTVLAALKKIGKVHKPAVQHAGFMVLKSPDIPSLLVETAFISNPKEEAKLRSKSYQRKIARALKDGVLRYFNQNPLPDTRFAESYLRQHKVNNGDTLSEIAERYAVSMESIKLANEMTRDRVRTGEILTIP